MYIIYNVCLFLMILSVLCGFANSYLIWMLSICFTSIFAGLGYTWVPLTFQKDTHKINKDNKNGILSHHFCPSKPTASIASTGALEKRPMTVHSNRWAKHAAERDQKIQSAAIAMRVLLPEVAEEKIQSCLRENAGDPNLAWHQLQDLEDPDSADPDKADPDPADSADRTVEAEARSNLARSVSSDSLGDILAAIEVAEMADVAKEAPPGPTFLSEAKGVAEVPARKRNWLKDG